MKPERLEEMLWERADGTIAPDELAKLEEFLSQHPESKDLEREIAELAELLSPRDGVKPPAVLRERIDRALEAATPPGHEVRTPRTAGARMRKDRWPVRLVPVAASLVLGVAIGYLLQPGTKAPVDESKVVGAMRATTEPSASAPVIVDLGADTGRIVANRVGSELVIDIGLVRQTGLRLDVEAPEGEIRLVGAIHSPGTPSEVTLENGRLTVRVRGPGTERVTAALTERTRVWIQVSAEGTAVMERWIE